MLSACVVRDGACAAAARACALLLAVSFSAGMQYVVLKAQRREGTRFNWRNAQSNWRWLFGMPPLLDPGQRLQH